MDDGAGLAGAVVLGGALGLALVETLGGALGGALGLALVETLGEALGGAEPDGDGADEGCPKQPARASDAANAAEPTASRMALMAQA